MAASIPGNETNNGDSLGVYDQILYDVLIHAEWSKSGDLGVCGEGRALRSRVNLPARFSTATLRTLWTFLRAVGYPLREPHSCILPDGLLRTMSNALPWQISIDKEGQVIAILQEKFIEIRSARDDFVSIVGRCNIEEDAYPQWRRLAWNDDASLLAYADSKGRVKIFDLLGSLMYSIGSDPPTLNNDDASLSPSSSSSVEETDKDEDLSRAAAALIFTNRKCKTTRWCGELIVITYQGALYSYHLGTSDGAVHLAHQFLFSWPYVMGITSVVHVPEHSLLLVGGLSTDEKESPLITTSNSKKAAGVGLTAWRVLSDFPHYKLVSDLEEDSEAGAAKSKSFINKITGAFNWRRSEGMGRGEGVYQLRLSPDKTIVMSIHFSGKVCFWEVPSMRVRSSWELALQPGADEIHPMLVERRKRKRRRSDVDVSCGDPSPVIDASWWNASSISVARASGSVSVVSVDDFRNLLGASPEWFEPAPRIVPAANGRMMALECEKRTSSSKRKKGVRQSIVGEENVDQADASADCSDDDDDDRNDKIPSNFSSRVFSGLHALLFSALYFLTDAELFQLPSSKKQNDVSQITFRLVSLQSTTPEQLYSRKIDNEEYGEALSLAEVYGLDSDRVYQRQWRKAVVSSASIQDYLARVKNRKWVLAECVDRVPEDVDAQRALLEFGLSETDCEAVLKAGGDEVDGDDDYDDAAGEEDSRIYASERWRRWRQKLIDRIDPDRLNAEQRELLVVRKKILTFIDRLSTYELILGGGISAQENYDHKFFKRFRGETATKLAVQFAREKNLIGLDSVLTYHGKEALPHRLAIISNLPETMNPSEYRDLLSTLEETTSEDCGDWPQQAWRAPDWCELEKFFDDHSFDDGEFLYNASPQYRKFETTSLTKILVSEWFSLRAQELEALAGQVSFAAEFIAIGQELGFDVDEIQNELNSLSTMVYECRADPSLTLSKMREMAPLDQIKLMMFKSSADQFEENLFRWLVPFLKRREHQNKGDYASLLKEYLLDSSKENLSVAVHVFQCSRPDVPMESPIIGSEENLLALAMECIYFCEGSDQLANCYSILECLPERRPKLGKRLKVLHDQVDVLEKHLKVAKILEQNEMLIPIAVIKETEINVEDAFQLVVKLSRVASRKTPQLNKSQWVKLIADILTIRITLYEKTLSIQQCLEIVCQSLLCSGRENDINLAKEYICTNEMESPIGDNVLGTNSKIPFQAGVAIIVKSAMEYFNSAASCHDAVMNLAKKCLALFPNSDAPEIVKERNLIEAVEAMSALGVDELPLQVRLCPDRMVLLTKILEKSPEMYHEVTRMTKLAAQLNIDGEDASTRRGRVMQLLAERSLDANDFLTCYEYCSALMNYGYSPIWSTCHKLASQPEFKSYFHKKQLLAFALTYCSQDLLESLLMKRMLVESQILYQELSSEIDVGEPEEENQKDDLDSTLDENEFFDSVEEPTSAATKENSPFFAMSHMLSTMSDKGWWSSSIKSMAGQILSVEDKEKSVNAAKDEKKLVVTMEAQGCHPLYEEQIDKPIIDDTFLDYASLKLLPADKTVLRTQQKLLRKSGLEACFTDGGSVQDVEDLIAQSSPLFLQSDLQLGVGLLFADADALDSIDEVLLKLPRTPLSLTLACYVYSLLILQELSRRSQEASKVTDSVQKYLKSKPSLVIKTASHAVLSDEPAPLPNAARYAEGLRRYLGMLEEFLHEPDPCGWDDAEDIPDVDMECATPSEGERLESAPPNEPAGGGEGNVWELLSNQSQQGMLRTLSAGIGALTSYSTTKK